jgi:GNAT superfamily N-acetyltransferase
MTPTPPLAAVPSAVELPAIPGLAFRRMRAPDDYVAMNAVANRCRVADGDAFATSVEELAAYYGHLKNCDPEHDVFVVVVGDTIVGYARTSWSEERAGEGAEVHELVCFLDPEWRRRGIGSAMLATLEARAREVASVRPAVPARYLQAGGSDRSGGQAALLLASGYEPVRHSYTMVRPTLDDEPDAPMPPGLEVREVAPEHLRTIWEAEVEAMADEWGSRAPSETDFQAFLDHASPSETALWRVAWDGDQVAGMVRSYISEAGNQRDGTSRGWVENISVRRPWRRRGLARALIAASLPLLRARGMTDGALSVDTQNPSGALRLYERVGFLPVARETMYRKRFVDAPTSPGGRAMP